MQRAVRTVFERYSVEPSAWAVVRWAREAGFLFPSRRHGAAEVQWKPLDAGRLCALLHIPVYAGRPIDQAVEELLLKTVVPSELDLSLAVEREVDAQAEALAEQWRARIEQTEYAARLAERRYKAVDPDNRVVARTLERQWEERLRELEEVQRQYKDARHWQLWPSLVDKVRSTLRETAAAVVMTLSDRPASRSASVAGGGGRLARRSAWVMATTRRTKTEILTPGR